MISRRALGAARACCAALLCCLLLVPMIVRAGDAPVVFQSTETPPFWSPALPEHGLGGALLHLLSESAGVKYTLEYLPVKRFRNSSSPFIVGDPDVLIYKENRAIFPLVTFRSAFFYYKPHHEEIRFRDIRDLQGHTMGVLRGTLEDREYFVRKGVKVEESDSEVALLKKLHRGRVDFVILVEPSGFYAISKIFPQEADNFTAVAIAGTERPIAVMVDISDPEGRAIAQRYSRVIKTTLRSPQYRAILERHVGGGITSADNDRVLSGFTKFYENTWVE